MPVSADRPAPYAPASAVLDLISRHRNKGLPTPVDGDVLARAGISPSLIQRTLQTLQTLDLIDEGGGPTDAMERLRLAPENEFKQRMLDWLVAAYRDALTFVDPATATEGEIRDAFRSYKPIGQQGRMVTLFIGLFAAAGVGIEKPRVASRRTQGATAPRKAQSNRTVAGADRLVSGPQSPAVAGPGVPAGLPPPILGLLAGLPTLGDAWSRRRRDQFVATFGAVLDFCFPVTDQE